jgi:hypothetical protein
MRVIVLAGLVSVEKIELAAVLAKRLIDAGQTVTVIDHQSRMPLHDVRFDGTLRARIDGDLQDGLLPALTDAVSDAVLLLVSETVPPDDLFTLLDDARRAAPALDVYTLALIDTRTCDCFPEFRVTLEAYADEVVRLPAVWDDVAEGIV